MTEELDFNLELEIDELEKMVDTTEEFYGLISDQLPAIEQEIDDTIEETELLIDYFTETSGSSKIEKIENIELEKGAQIAEVLSNLQERINSVYKSLSARHDITELLEGFVQKDTQEEAEFEKILTVIDELNRVLKDLDKLSINAVIFSFKQNQEGAAFRVISDEINDLSSQLQDKYQTIEDNVYSLQDWYDSFTSELEELITAEEKISTDYKGEIEAIFTDILNSLQTVSDILRDFMNHIQTAVEPIYDIIVLLQNQDIIRQNIENLSEIITTLQAEIDGLDLEEMEPKECLNILVFIIDASHLAQKLMNNILNQLDDSLFKIQDKFDQIEKELNEVAEEGTEVFSFFAGGDETGESSTSVDLIYRRLTNFVPQLIDKLDSLVVSYQEIIDDQDKFYSLMDELQAEFLEINKVADKFQRLEVLARIEFTRMDSTDKSFIHNIEEAIERFIDSSDKNQEMYDQLEEELMDDYDEFIELSRRDKKKIDESREIIEESEEKLLMTKKLIKEAIHGLHQSIDELVTDILEVNDQIEEVYHLREIGNEFISKLENLETEAKEIKKEYLSRLDRQEWEVDNSRLQELEDKFSSYIERKTASEEVTNMDIDTGSEGGELTMF